MQGNAKRKYCSERCKKAAQRAINQALLQTDELLRPDLYMLKPLYDEAVKARPDVDINQRISLLLNKILAGM
jgi:hypothetical protein